jgi:hypothetical protein
VLPAHRALLLLLLLLLLPPLLLLVIDRCCFARTPVMLAFARHADHQRAAWLRASSYA